MTSTERERLLQIALRQVDNYAQTLSAANRQALSDISQAWNNGVRFHPEHDIESNWDRRQRLLAYTNSPAIIKASKTEELP